MLKLKNHIQLRIIQAGILSGIIRTGKRRLTHRKDSLSVMPYLTVHLFYIIMGDGKVHCIRYKIAQTIFSNDSIGKFRILTYIINNIQTESIHSFIQPPIHHAINLIS